VTREVSAPESTATETIKRIGPPLVVGSVLGSTLGIVVAQFADDLGDGILAVILGGNAIVYNNRVEITGASDLAWAGGFLLCLIIGFLALFTYPTARGHGVARLTLLWMVLHLLRQAFVQAVLLPLDSTSDLALAYETLDAPPGLDVVIAAGGGVGLLLIALSAASAFLAFAPHHRMISTGRKRFTFAFWIALVPAVAAAFIAIPFFLPDAGSGVVPSLPLTAVIFLATVAAAPGTTTVFGPEDTRETPWPWGLGATLVVILLVQLLVFAGGVSVDPTRWG
jgi:GNAT superfamily N-acetyltransferase